MPDDEPIEDVIQETVDGVRDPTTRREAVELELEDRDRSGDRAEVEVEDVVPADSPAQGVVDRSDPDPPEPSEPG